MTGIIERDHELTEMFSEVDVSIPLAKRFWLHVMEIAEKKLGPFAAYYRYSRYNVEFKEWFRKQSMDLEKRIGEKAMLELIGEWPESQREYREAEAERDGR